MADFKSVDVDEIIKEYDFESKFVYVKNKLSPFFGAKFSKDKLRKMFMAEKSYTLKSSDSKTEFFAIEPLEFEVEDDDEEYTVRFTRISFLSEYKHYYIDCPYVITGRYYASEYDNFHTALVHFWTFINSLVTCPECELIHHVDEMLDENTCLLTSDKDDDPCPICRCKYTSTVILLGNMKDENAAKKININYIGKNQQSFFRSKVTLKCKHAVCDLCWHQTKGNNCPICRQPHSCDCDCEH